MNVSQFTQSISLLPFIYMRSRNKYSWKIDEQNEFFFLLYIIYPWITVICSDRKFTRLAWQCFRSPLCKISTIMSLWTTQKVKYSTCPAGMHHIILKTAWKINDTAYLFLPNITDNKTRWLRGINYLTKQVIVIVMNLSIYLNG